MCWPHDITRAYTLLPSYITEPDLALSVKEFVTGSAWIGISEGSSPHSDAEHATMNSYISELDLDAKIRREMLESLTWWRQRTKLGGKIPQEDENELHESLTATITALLLSLCKNVETLYFEDMYRGLLRNYLLASNYGLTSRPALQRLRHVAFHPTRSFPEDDRWYADIDFLNIIRCIHRLPKLESLTMEGVAEGEVEDGEPFPAKTSRGLKRISLRHMDIHPNLLHTIVRIPAGLEELSLSFGGLWAVDGYGGNLEPATLGKALRQHKKTLRVLDLDMGSAIISNFIGRWPEEDEEPGYYDTDNKYYQMDLAEGEMPLYADQLRDEHETFAIGSLTDYAALTRLSISIEAMTVRRFYYSPDTPQLIEKPEYRLINTLPPNLEYLCLYDYEKGKSPRVDGEVAELMENKSERFPKLKEIVGVDKPELGVFTDRPDAPRGRRCPEEMLWEWPEDHLDGTWVEE